MTLTTQRQTRSGGVRTLGEHRHHEGKSDASCEGWLVMVKKRISLVLFFLILGLGSASESSEEGTEIFQPQDLIRLREPSSFYPAPAQDSSEIFRTGTVQYPYSFIVYGDSREIATYEKTRLLKQVLNENPAFVIHLGDMVYCADDHQWELFDLFDGKIIDRRIPLYPVLGNHEYRTRTNAAPPNPEKQLQYYFNRFTFLKERRWYSFVYGCCQFLILDTNTDYSPGSEQYAWLLNNLKKKSTTFLFVAFHHPPYTKSYYGRDSEKFLAKLFEGSSEGGLAKPDIVFSSHVHNYERYCHNGIYYVVSGGGGAEPYVVTRDPDDFYAKSGDSFHYCRLTVSKAEATFEMVRFNESSRSWTIEDRFTITK